jgi:aspartokinase/homoserine dehydrogenase 1
MKVLKFGGSSLATGERIKNVAQIIIKSKSKKNQLLVVVSAFGGITDLLIRCGQLAQSGNNQYEQLLSNISERCIQINNELFPQNSENTLLDQQLNSLLEELAGLLNGIYLLRELSDRSQALLVSFGERISATTLSYYLNSLDYTTEYLDARNFIKTDSNFLKASVDFLATHHLIRNHFKNKKDISVITGFISSNHEGTTTVLGRGGSDYSASIFGAALSSKVIEIWTDVNGVMSADPRKVSDAFTIPQLTYDEASEISHFGAKVIYPPSIIPAKQIHIPIVIKNSFQPSHPGTIINHEKIANQYILKGVTSIPNVSMITLTGGGLVGVPGSAAKLFQALSQYNINIILISQGSSENSISYVISSQEANRAVIAQNKAFEKEILAGIIEEAKVQNNLCIISIVGENMYRTPGIAGKMFRTLGTNGINVFAIAQGSSELNISAVIHIDNEIKGLQLLHEMFFLSKNIRINLFLAGTGLIASTLLKQIEKQNAYLIKNKNIEIKLIGITNTSKMFFQKEGISLKNWKKELNQEGSVSNNTKFVDMCIEANLPNSIFVDCTASGDIPSHFERILNHSISISTPNKISVSEDFNTYSLLKEIARKNNALFCYETTVGAGLPILTTLNNLLESGDKILSIEGVFSGSVSYIFNTFSDKIPFSDVVEDASKKGYTEPDPRIDLNGIDVTRKLTILSREAGFNLKKKDFKVKKFLPKAIQQAKTMDEFWMEINKSNEYFENLATKAKNDKSKLRFIGTITKDSAQLSLKSVNKKSPFYHLNGSDNMIVFTTERYKDRPLVIQGPGAGAEVTASGIFAEILSIISFIKD